MSHLGQLNLRAQGDFKRVLFVCSGGMLRSATASHIFAAEPYNWNTRAAGIMDGAIVTVDHKLCEWAQEIYVMGTEHARAISEKFKGQYDSKVQILGIPDQYFYREPMLVEYLKGRIAQLQKGEPTEPR
jgi:predicted protein tyrosine phosphatase